MPRLALVMIARNEARCIARCLDSVRSHVDAMIVLDTGSTDDTVAIAEGYATAASLHEATGRPVAVAFDVTDAQAGAFDLVGRIPAGIKLGPQKRNMVYNRLLRRLRTRDGPLYLVVRNDDRNGMVALVAGILAQGGVGIENMSLGIDMKILIYTALIVMQGRGK